MEVDLQKNDEVVVRVEDYNSEGMGVAHCEGRAVFVPHTARGDAARVLLVKAPPRGPFYGRLLVLESPSPHRVTPACPLSEQCGGCDFQHITYEEELRAKQTRVEAAMERVAGFAWPVASVHPAPELSAYRNKALYPVREREGRVCTGFFRARSHDLVPMERCLLQHPDADRAAGALRAFMEDTHLSAYDETTGRGHVRHLLVRRSADSGELLIVPVTTTPLRHPERLVEVIRRVCPQTAGVVNIVNSRRDNVILDGKETVLYGQSYLTERLCGLSFRVSARSFFQVNTAQAETLYKQALALREHDAGLLLDLCCGTGSSTLCLADGAREAIGLDLSGDAIEDARVNALSNGLEHITFHCADMADTEHVLGARRPDIITVDPPRKGMHPATIDAIGRLAPRQVVYISCDPATLARDVKQLLGFGYRPDALRMVDMFPRTSNVECVAALHRMR